MTLVPLVLRAAVAAVALTASKPAHVQENLPGNPIVDQLHVQNRLIGRELYDRSGAMIGTVESVIRTQNGMVVGVGVDIGSFLGMGPRRITVPAIQLQSVDNVLTTRDLTRETAEQMPAR